jgi:UDP-glucuronate 4-epimerase
VVKIAESFSGAEGSGGAKGSNSSQNYKVYNIGRGEQVQLMEFIDYMSQHLGVEAKINMLPMQDGDVPRTMANTEELQKDFGYQPSVSVDQGVEKFAKWYKQYYSL